MGFKMSVINDNYFGLLRANSYGDGFWILVNKEESPPFQRERPE
jgi:hypothetical protein